jgi:hypothetical protein
MINKDGIISEQCKVVKHAPKTGLYESVAKVHDYFFFAPFQEYMCGVSSNRSAC